MYVAIEGSVGSGETTVVSLLAVERNINCILENHEANLSISSIRIRQDML